MSELWCGRDQKQSQLKGAEMGDITVDFSVVGTVDSDGLVRSDRYGPVIGRVEDGVVHRDQFSSSPVGRVESDGKIFRGDFGYDQVAHVDNEGTVYLGSGYEKIASVEPPHMQSTAAAYVLLIR